MGSYYSWESKSNNRSANFNIRHVLNQKSSLDFSPIDLIYKFDILNKDLVFYLKTMFCKYVLKFELDCSRNASMN